MLSRMATEPLPYQGERSGSGTNVHFVATNVTLRSCFMRDKCQFTDCTGCMDTLICDMVAAVIEISFRHITTIFS